MKVYKLILGLVTCLLAIVACVVQDELDITPTPLPVSEGEKVTLSFGVAFPIEEESTKTIRDVTDLQLLVFDENNQFVAKAEAILEDVILFGTDSVRTFKVTLLSSGRPRYIHFIAGYDWTGFKTTHELLFLDEGEIIPGLVSTDPRTVYWNRIALDGSSPLGFGTGINENTFKNKVVTLIRNQAKISLAENTSNFELTGYTVYNRPSHGSVAAFKYDPLTFSYTYVEGQLTVPSNAVTLPIPADPGGYINNLDGIKLYEWHNNGNNATRVFVIFKGNYQENLSGGGLGPVQYNRYYKLDLTNPINAGEVFDVIRNTHYQFDVQSVDFEGYPSAAAAAAAAASNNVFASLELRSYPYVSDGTSSLQVLKLEEIITQPGFTFQTNIFYVPDINFPASFAPNDIEVIPVQPFDAGNWTLNYNVSGGIGIFSATPTNIPSEGTITAEFKVAVKTPGSRMMRLIRLTLRQPYSLNVTTPANNANLSIGNNYNITFDVPATISDNLFPIKLYISSKNLSPRVDVGYDDKLLVITENNSYKYMYEIKAEKKGTTVTLHFKTNKDPGSETITIESPPYFVPVTRTITWN